MSGPALGLPPEEWAPDPTGRHRVRWWDGHGWTAFVADAGQRVIEDPAPLDPGIGPPLLGRPHLPVTARLSVGLGVFSVVAGVYGFLTLVFSGAQPADKVAETTRFGENVLWVAGGCAVLSLVMSLWVVTRSRLARTTPFIGWFVVSWSVAILLLLFWLRVLE
jgi:hypothetical protein